MKKLQSKHGIICSLPDEVALGYFGWPTVAKLQDGTIAAACSGFRAEHVCACGKSVLFRSQDNGQTWDRGQIIIVLDIDNITICLPRRIEPPVYEKAA